MVGIEERLIARESGKHSNNNTDELVILPLNYSNYKIIKHVLCFILSLHSVGTGKVIIQIRLQFWKQNALFKDSVTYKVEIKACAVQK